MPKQTDYTTAFISRRLSYVATRLIAWYHSHIWGLTIIAIALYLVLGQWAFVTSGMTWAESFSEYLDEAVRLPWSEVWAPSWVGYLTLIPSFFSKLYVSLHLSLGVIDYFFQAVTILFVVLSAGFVAAQYNRALIKSDSLRLLLALGLVVIMADVATFSFINAWYAGFVPLLFIALNPAPLPKPGRVLYVVAGSLICLTKPSLLLAPFFIYRAIKTKEYISNGLLVAVTFYQTYCLLYLTKTADSVSVHDAALIIKVMVMGAASALFKLIHVYPGNTALAIGIALTVYAVCAGLLVWRRGIWLTLLLLVALALSVYGHVLPPGEHTFEHITQVKQIYDYTFKPQREFMVAAVLLIIGFLVLHDGITWIRSQIPKRYSWIPLATTVTVVLLVGAHVYQPIDAARMADIGPYRSSLAAGQPVCIPLPVPMPTPTPVIPKMDVNWLFQYGDGCSVQYANKPVNRYGFTIELISPRVITVPTPDEHALKSLLIMVKVDHQATRPIRLTLRDTLTDIPYYAIVYPTNSSYAMVSFNTAGLPIRKAYRFTLSTEEPGVYLGQFTNGEGVVQYPYFMGGRSAYR